LTSPIDPPVLTWNDGFHFALQQVDKYLDNMVQSSSKNNDTVLDVKLYVRELSKIPVQVEKEKREVQ